MAKKKKQLVGKIGFCYNTDLGINDIYGKPLKGGHYVYIRQLNGNRCDVNIITSLEDEKGKLLPKKINKVKRGLLYAIPTSDTNFERWSAINLDGNVKNVKLSKIKSIGVKSVRKRHKFFVGKFTKK